MFLAGWSVHGPGEIDHEVLDRAVAPDRGRHIIGSEPPQPSLAEIRREYGESLSDEELLLRYLIPGPDVDAMYAAASPIEPIHPVAGPNCLGWLCDLLRPPNGRAVDATSSRAP